MYIPIITEFKNLVKYYNNILSKITIFDIRRDFEFNLDKLKFQKQYKIGNQEQLDKRLNLNIKLLNYIDIYINYKYSKEFLELRAKKIVDGE